uniref:acyltransferase family protein n=1 Tax=Enterocloster hominis (ex Hitch et al. 2024) TaxID=1917870 RepID=UPI0010321E9B|nr:acyltransferase [Lachnoclostridium pacaense]
MNEMNLIKNRPDCGGGGIQKNSLNLLRLLAAIQVFYGHAVVHMNLSGTSVAGIIMSIFQGVPIFFILSGFLIWNSIEKTPNLKTYVRKRIFRIYPELWCAITISIISIFFLYDRWNVKDLMLFIVTQSTIMQFWTPDSLRGFGCGTPNGSLWTITVIVQFYIVAWVIKKFLSHENKKRWFVTIAISLAIGIGSPQLEKLLSETIYKLYEATFIPYFWIFMTGALLCNYFKEIMPILKKFWWVGLALLLAVIFTGFDIDAGYGLLQTILKGVTWVGFAYAFPGLNIKDDISYGIYIYHMVIVNILIELGLVGSWIYFFIALIVTIGIATVSYLIVGNVGSKKKGQL